MGDVGLVVTVPQPGLAAEPGLNSANTPQYEDRRPRRHQPPANISTATAITQAYHALGGSTVSLPGQDYHCPTQSVFGRTNIHKRFGIKCTDMESHHDVAHPSSVTLLRTPAIPQELKQSYAVMLSLAFLQLKIFLALETFSA